MRVHAEKVVLCTGGLSRRLDLPGFDLTVTHSDAWSLTSVPGKRQFLRGRLTEDGRAEVVGGPGSHLVATLAASELLIVVPEGVTSLAAGGEVDTVFL